MKGNNIIPAALLAGTIIGAGIFALPYVSIKAGIVIALISMGLFTALMISIHTMYADVVVDIGHEHRFAGIAQRYMGKKGYVAAIAMTIVHMMFVLAIYILFAQGFLGTLLSQEWALYGAIIFWALGSITMYLSVKAVSIIETIAVIGIIAVVGIIMWYGAPNIQLEKVPLIGESFAYVFIPFGVLLFALNGRPAIPGVVSYCVQAKESKKTMRRIIITGTIVAGVVYAFFIVGVVGSSDYITQDALSGLTALPQWVKGLLVLLGILAVITSYIAVAQDVRKSLQHDVRFSKWGALILTATLPLGIYMLRLGSLVELLEIAGGLFVSFEGLMIIRMWKKHKKQSKTSIMSRVPQWWILIMQMLFITSIIYVIYEITL